MQSRKRTLATLFATLLTISTSAAALHVQTNSSGVVKIGQAISPQGVTPDIHLVEHLPDGRTDRVPLQEVTSARVEIRDGDMLIHDVNKNGRFHAMVIERKELGSHQLITLGLSGNSNVASSSRFGEALPPPPQPWQSYLPPVPALNPVVTMPPPGPMASLQPLPRHKPKKQPTTGASLFNRTFTGEDWSNRDLGGSLIVNSQFVESDLAAASFSGARLVNVQLQSSNLTDVRFDGAQLVNIDFKDSDLQQADFSGAHVVNVDFNQANLSGAKWWDGRVCASGSIGECR